MAGVNNVKADVLVEDIFLVGYFYPSYKTGVFHHNFDDLFYSKFSLKYILSLYLLNSYLFYSLV